ncbi:hypothetical protein QNH20_24795 [Neobacillus sp. WH10]|uniref:hypothetical protein n=1 Tax=Neobacillus sp. WH10 TaxID=3047873 RepID=UPI0024C12491|nr:hypothetical protein [Neobacillus sp. WH10]WHY77253.1 hypothetical protein QNH20_24795 [Neobacillus sp. WH10]
MLLTVIIIIAIIIIIFCVIDVETFQNTLVRNVEFAASGGAPTIDTALAAAAIEQQTAATEQQTALVDQLMLVIDKYMTNENNRTLQTKEKSKCMV